MLIGFAVVLFSIVFIYLWKKRDILLSKIMMAESKDAGKTLAEDEIDDEGIYSSLFSNFGR